MAPDLQPLTSCRHDSRREARNRSAFPQLCRAQTLIHYTGGAPLLPGESDIDQLGRVAQMYGGLSAEAWPGIAAAPDFAKLRFRPVPAVPLAALLPGASSAALALMSGMLRLDPGEPLSAQIWTSVQK